MQANRSWASSSSNTLFREMAIQAARDRASVSHTRWNVATNIFRRACPNNDAATGKFKMTASPL